jgi:integrase
MQIQPSYLNWSLTNCAAGYTPIQVLLPPFRDVSLPFVPTIGLLRRSGGRSDDPSLDLDRPKLRRGLPRPVAGLPAVMGRLDPETHAIAVFLVETGLRISEGCSVFVRPPAPPELTVLGKGSKERIVPLTAQARAALDALGGAIPVSARTVQRRFRALGFSPHRLRYTLATELARSDVDS